MKIKEEEIIRLMSGEKSREKGVRLMMDAYQSRLYWHIRRIIVDHALSQDVLQETFIKAYQNFHQFKQDSQLYTWLYRIATNESLQQLNKLKRMQKSDEDSEYYLQNLVADNVSAEAEEAIKGNDKDAIEAKTNALMQASQKLGEKVYADAQAAQNASAGQGSGAAGGSSKASDPDVVDAEFTEVKDDNK